MSSPAFPHWLTHCSNEQRAGLGLLLSSPQGRLSHTCTARASPSVLPRRGVRAAPPSAAVGEEQKSSPAQEAEGGIFSSLLAPHLRGGRWYRLPSHALRAGSFVPMYRVNSTLLPRHETGLGLPGTVAGRSYIRYPCCRWRGMKGNKYQIITLSFSSKYFFPGILPYVLKY